MSEDKCSKCGSILVYENSANKIRTWGVVILIILTILSGFTLFVPFLMAGIGLNIWANTQSGRWVCPKCDK